VGDSAPHPTRAPQGAKEITANLIVAPTFRACTEHREGVGICAVQGAKEITPKGNGAMAFFLDDRNGVVT